MAQNAGERKLPETAFSWPLKGWNIKIEIDRQVEQYQKYCRSIILYLKTSMPCPVSQDCNPSTLEGQGGWITWDQQLNTILSNMVKSYLYQKKYKIRWVWWGIPVITATGTAEVGELLEAGRQLLQWAWIVPLHSSLGNNRESPSEGGGVQSTHRILKNKNHFSFKPLCFGV